MLVCSVCLKPLKALSKYPNLYFNPYSRFGEFVGSKLSQFRFNTYLRMFMLVYFDFTFFSIMKIIEGNNNTMMRKIALFVSYFFFVISIVIPVFLIALLLKR